MRKLLIICLIFVAVQAHAIHVVFRLDDPSLQYDSVSMRAVKLFNHKQVPLSIAIVACDELEQPILPITHDDSLYLLELLNDNIELTLHGYNHQDIERHGEFGGISYIEAHRRIQIAKDVIKKSTSKDIVTFIPPFNAFNDSTLVAMMDNGLHILSADMYGPATNPNIQYYHETLGHLMAQKGMWQAAEDAIFGCKQKDAICVVMFHHYDLPDEASWQRLEKLLDACKVNENVQCHTYQSLLASGVESSAIRYRANQLRSGLQKYCLREGVLHTTWLCWLVHVLNALTYASLPLVLLVGWFRRRQALWLIATITGSLVFGGLALWSVMGPMKLLTVDMVYVAIASVSVWGVSRIRCKK